MEVKGKITHVLEQEKGTSAKGDWCKQTFVILEDKEQYPKSIAIDVFNEKVNIPPIGTMVNAFINIESREYNGKWYTNVGVWKMDIVGQVTHQTPPPPSEPVESDDLPF